MKIIKSPISIENYKYKIYNLFGFVLNHTVNWGDPVLRGANNKVDAVKWEGDPVVPWDGCNTTQIYSEENTAYV